MKVEDNLHIVGDLLKISQRRNIARYNDRNRLKREKKNTIMGGTYLFEWSSSQTLNLVKRLSHLSQVQVVREPPQVELCLTIKGNQKLDG